MSNIKKNSITTVYDCNLIQLPKVVNDAGNITAVSNDHEIPFAVKRVYYLYDIPGGEARGAHAHRELRQMIVAASGSFDIILNDGKIKRTIHLNRPDYGLYMPAGIWRELDNFSSGAICLVLASEIYKTQDYIREYKEFIKFKELV